MILVIDNYDSFTYNLVQLLGEIGADPIVHRNDEITIDQIEELQPAGIMLSPGPCSPSAAGVCLSVLAGALGNSTRPFFQTVPIFGVCLGHQSAGHVGGGGVIRAKQPRHGKTSMIEHDGQGVFKGVPSPFEAVRYHSLVVDPERVPPGFIVTARSLDDNEIMGMRHESLSIEGVQFHPESILTQHGKLILENFVNRTR